MDEIHQLVSVELLDTDTGKKATVADYSTWFWTEGNGSCDCNRDLVFSDLEEDNDVEIFCVTTCRGCHRFLITKVSPMPPGFVLDDFNCHYPSQLRQQFCR